MKCVIPTKLIGLGVCMVVLGATLLPLLTTDDQAVVSPGPTWSTPIDIDPGHNLRAVSCSSDAFCVAIDTQGNAIIFGGSNFGGWGSPSPISPPGLVAISCASPTFCGAINGEGYFYAYNGTSWSTPVLVDGSGPNVENWNEPGLDAISCPSPGFCAAVDANGNAFEYSGTSWSAPTLVSSAVDGGFVTNSVSCVSATFCVAVADALGVGYVFTYDGTGWTTTNVFASGVLGTGNVSCASTTFCAAVGIEGNNSFGVSLYHGTNWSAPTTVEPAGDFPNAISCPTSSFCAIVGLSGNGNTYDGNVWSPFTLSVGNLESVSCPSSSLCVAVDPPAPYAFMYGHFATLQIVTGSLSPGVAAATYSAPLAAIGGNGNHKWSISSGHLPKGLRLKKSTGVISGKPNKHDSGTYTFTVKVETKAKTKPHTVDTASRVLLI